MPRQTADRGGPRAWDDPDGAQPMIARFGALPPPYQRAAPGIVDVRCGTAVNDGDDNGAAGLMAELDRLCELWTAGERPAEYGAWAAERFGLRLGEVVAFEELERRYCAELENALTVYLAFMQRRLAGDDSETGLQTRESFSRLFDAITFAYHAVEATWRGMHAFLGEYPCYSSPELHTFRYSLLDPSDLLPKEQLAVFLLQRLHARGYRRYRGMVYEQVMVPAANGGGERADEGARGGVVAGPLPTHAWRKKCEIKDFVYRTVRKETMFQQWRNLMKGRCGKDVIEYLSNCWDTEFTELQPDRHAFSFRNGVYHAKQMIFWPYGAADLPPDLVTCKYFDSDFPEHLIDAGDTWYDDIPTPSLQRILDDQELGVDENERRRVCEWLYVFLGRLLYDVNEMDGWQVALFIKGIAGSGKSTIAHGALNFYDPDDVAAMSANGEKQFGLEGIFDKFLFVCQEVKEQFNLTQAELQLLLSGETMSIACKYRTARTVTWKVPGIFMGNELAAWIDAQGSMVRRLVLLEFTHAIARSDPNLARKLLAETPYLILKCNLAYRDMVRDYNEYDFWQIPTLPQYFKQTREHLQAQINPVAGFLMDEESVDLADGRYTLMRVFMERLNAWMKAHRYRGSKFTRDQYESIFAQRGLPVKSETRWWGDRMTSGFFVIGAGLVGGQAFDRAPQLGGGDEADGVPPSPGYAYG